MKKTILLKLTILVAVFLTASVASAADSTWIRPATSGPGNYNDPANWDAGGVPTLTSDAIHINGGTDTPVEIQVTDAQFYGKGKFWLGESYSSTSPGAVLRIMNGGSLTSPAVCPYVAGEIERFYVGYNQPAHMIIEAGGTFKTYWYLYWGLTGNSYGTVDIAGVLDVSECGKFKMNDIAAAGRTNVLDGGLLKHRSYEGWAWSMGAENDVMVDVQGTGKITVPGNELSDAQALIANGKFYGNGVVGEVIAVYDAGTNETWIIATPTPAAQNLLPEDGDDDVPVANPLTLSWTIPSAYGGNDVYVNVWLGTDPNALTAEPNVPAAYMSPVTLSPASGLNVTSVDIDASVEDTYYWRVDLNVGPDVNVLSPVHTFTTVSDLAPTVSIETLDTMTWSDESVALAATLVDDGESAVNLSWTAEPDGISDPNLNIAFSPSASVEDPTVTITNTTGAMVPVTLTLTATDAVGSADASVTIDVYEDACQMALYGVGETHLYADFNYDCTVDILDISDLAEIWLSANTLPTGPVEN